MIRSLRCGLLSAVVLAGGCEPRPEDEGPHYPDDETTVAEDPRFEELESYVEDEMDTNGVVGAAVAVVVDGRLAWSQGFGRRHMDRDDAVTPGTLFNIASTTKQFTAAAALTVRDDGALDVDVPIGTYVPYFGLAEGWDPDEVTLRRLLSHTAGYPNSFLGDADRSSRDLEDIFADNPDQPLLVAPGEVWNYSNLGFSLASLVVQEAAGEDFRDRVEDRVFAPAGMETATLHVREAGRGEFAYGHCSAYCDELAVYEPLDYDSQIYWGQGGVWAGAEDLARWAEVVIAGNTVLSRESWDEMLSPQSETTAEGSWYGFGLSLSDLYGPRVVSHGGDNVGFHAQFVLVPEEGFAVVVLVNDDAYYPSAIAEEAARLFTSYAEPDWDALTPTAGELQDLVGSYTDPNWWGTFEITYDGDALWGRFVETGVEAEIYPSVGRGLYVWDGEAWQYATVWRDDDGAPRYLAVRSGVAERVP